MHLRVGAGGGTSVLLPVRPLASVCQRGTISLGPFVLQAPTRVVPSTLLDMIHRLLGCLPADYTLTVRYYPEDRT